MSYSFSVTAASKTEAIQKVSEEFDKVVVAQPAHALDRGVAGAAAVNFIGLLAEPGPTQEVYVNCYGSISYTDEGRRVVSANVSCSPSLRTKAGGA